MIDRGLAVFSGVHPKVVARIAPTLRSVGIEAVAVTLGDSADLDYFERLASQTLYVADLERRRTDVRLTSVLVSAIDGTALDLESTAFLPALRRLSIRPEWRNNPSAAARISSVVTDYFRFPRVREFARRLAASRETRLLLPMRNTPARSLTLQFKEIYDGHADQLSGRMEKDIAVLRGGRGLKASSLTFKPALNNGQHPIRRRSDSSLCDLQAAFRFGVAVPLRYEFDVTSDNGLKGKSFFWCDGSLHHVNRMVTHLNMRINDDFKEG